MSFHRRRGFTLVELLVSIATIGILMSLILPAVQQAREAARRTQCRNNLRQLAVAMHNHEAAFRRYPSNGWGYLWVGDPDRGTDRRQPGGWIYNILPYLEQQTLRDIGRGEAAAQQRQSLTRLMQRPLAVLNCPSRPDGETGPANPAIVPYNADWAPVVAKTDYAACEGDYITDTRGGPSTLLEGDRPNYTWRDVSAATGVCFLRSEVRPAGITDGLSHTVQLGEKYVSTAGYTTADDPGHDQTMYSGVDLDLNRWTLKEDGPRWDGEQQAVRAFGSPHTSGCHFAFCDGSVRMISHDVRRSVYCLLGNRRDGEPVSEETF